MRSFFLSIFIVLSIFVESCKANSEKFTTVRFETTRGSITLKLYPETNQHRQNFLKLVSSGYYNGVLFHRVIKDFMIQAGEPCLEPIVLKMAKINTDYTIPAEFLFPKYFHKRGALCAARQGDNINPLQASSGTQFYIVEGRIFSDQELDGLEIKQNDKIEIKVFNELIKAKSDIIAKFQKEKNELKLDSLRSATINETKAQIKTQSLFKFTPEQREIYKTFGGTPHLDGSYTVFGEVIEGMEIVSEISKSETDESNRPIRKISILKAVVLN